MVGGRGKCRLGVLVSGRGSNLQALIDACADPGFPATIAAVVSNRPDAGGLARAQAAGIATSVVDHKLYATREAFEAHLHAALEEAGVDLLCAAGFMRVLTASFIARWEGRFLNVHPSLLPSFPGLHPQQQALDAGVKVSGCTVHFVTAEVDAGPIVAQVAVPVLEGDTADTLAARILNSEHRLYPRAVRLVAEGRVRIEGARAHVDERP
ncbi:MAG: phosphoribosylglycinamide formyltransferase [Alphaproteobacteria bacterium]|nr:phosphoribosylglycinamide formyltransferase [Alphaproteobacteria bacterium]